MPLEYFQQRAKLVFAVMTSMRLFLGTACFLALTVSADVITDWNGLLLDAIRSEDNSPTLAARSLAILHTAIYDAVNSVERTYQPYFVNLVAAPGASAEVAAVAAAHEVLLDLYPTERARFEDFFSAYLATVPP